MILQSQPPSSFQPRQAPMSLRDMMKQNDLSFRNSNNNQVLPMGINNPTQFPQNIQNNAAMATAETVPIYPPNHIEQQPSVSVSNYNENLNQAPPPIYRSPPRRHKIFQNAQSPNKNANKSTPPIQSAYTFGNTPASQPQNTNYMSANNSTNTVNQSIYQTVKSVKSKVDRNRNNTITEQQVTYENNNKEPSGISLRSKRAQSQHQMIPQQNSKSYQSLTPMLKQTSLNSVSGPSPTPLQRQPLQAGSLLINRQTQNNQNPLSSLNRSVSPNPPLPVYENSFYKTSNLNNSRARLNSAPLHANQPYYTNISANPMASQQQNPYIDALLQDFNRYQKRNPSPGQLNSSKYYQFNQPPPQFNLISQPPLHGELQRPFSPPYNPNNFSSPPMQYNNNMNNMNRNQPIVTSLSPFEQNQRQQLKDIPRRFDNIQQKVIQHERQLNQMNSKLNDFKLKDGEAQRNLLGQLISKQQQLTQKQRQINVNLQRMAKIQSQNNLKKQQILKYQLQLQRAKRVQQIAKQNQRLYHQLIRKEANQKQNIKNNFVPLYTPQIQQILPIVQIPQVITYNKPIQFDRFTSPTKLQSMTKYQTYDELSPFTINPDHY